MDYPIVETFHSVQGEGLWSGCSSLFIRLGGCDVGCPWCDTKHSWPQDRHPRRAIADLVAEAVAAAPRFVTITGGEPLLHDLEPLTAALAVAGLRRHLETSGAHPFSGRFDWVTLSPKPLREVHPSVYPQVQELKVVVQSEADLAFAEAQAERLDGGVALLLQPEAGTAAATDLIFEYVRRHPRWRFSLQTHKLLGVR